MMRALCLVIGCISSVAAAQDVPVQPTTAARTIDRIVAIVGSRAILASQLEEEMVQQQAQGRQLPTDSAARAQLRRELLQEMIEEELLVQQAQRDTSVKITEQEVLDQVEQSYQNVRKQFASDAEFRNQLRAARFGSVEEWRRWLADGQRRALYARRLIEALQQRGKLRSIPPTEEQMREFWDQNRAAQPRRPATVSFRQIVVKPQPDTASKARARQLAESLVVELRRGADFANAAKRFSADSASAAQGGELGWFRRGVMVTQFEDVAFNIRPGEISPVVETPFGFHIIRVERTQPAEVLARHILIPWEISPAQIEKARHLADSVRTLLTRGAAFDSLARLYADPQEPKIAEEAPVTQLPPEYQEALANDTTVGLKPVLPASAGSKLRFVVIDITARRGDGDLTYDEVKTRIRQTLGEQLAIRHYIGQLRKQSYIDVRL